MPIDFRASQVQANKVIASGSTGTGATMLVYPIAAEAAATPNQGTINPAAFGTGSIGTDIFLYVSGARSSKDTANSNGVACFGGDVVASGTLTFSGTLYTQTASVYLTIGSNGNLTFFDSSNTAGWTLTQLAQSGSDSPGGSATLNSASIVIVTSSYSITTSDFIIGVSASSAVEITLPGSPTTGLRHYVKDISGSAASANITVVTGSSSHRIDGFTSYVIAINRGSAQFVYFGNNNWGIV